MWQQKLLSTCCQLHTSEIKRKLEIVIFLIISYATISPEAPNYLGNTLEAANKLILFVANSFI